MHNILSLLWWNSIIFLMEDSFKGDWIQTIKNDYAFIGEDLEQIETYIKKSTSKYIFI